MLCSTNFFIFAFKCIYVFNYRQKKCRHCDMTKQLNFYTCFVISILFIYKKHLKSSKNQTSFQLTLIIYLMFNQKMTSFH